MTSLRIAAWVSGLFLLAVGAAHLAKADVLVTTNGSRFEGLVSQEADRYVVTFPNGGRMKFPKDTVREVIKTDAHETPPPPGPAAPRPTQPSSSPTGADKEAIALRLVGDSLKVIIDATLDLADSEEMKRATQLMQKTLDLLKQKGVADGLREAACNIGRTGHQYRLLTVLVSGRPEIADIKKALGSEDRSQQEGYFEELSGPDKAPAIFPKEEPGKQLKPIIWYEYGWLRFGVIEGKVRCIRADCQQVLTGKKSDDIISTSSTLKLLRAGPTSFTLTTETPPLPSYVGLVLYSERPKPNQVAAGATYLENRFKKLATTKAPVGNAPTTTMMTGLEIMQMLAENAKEGLSISLSPFWGSGNKGGAYALTGDFITIGDVRIVCILICRTSVNASSKEHTYELDGLGLKSEVLKAVRACAAGIVAGFDQQGCETARTQFP
jgi:hypothetical protein